MAHNIGYNISAVSHYKTFWVKVKRLLKKIY